MQYLARTLLLSFTVLIATSSFAQEIDNVDKPSVARQWTESLLFAIRRDLARPTVHARNLYHLSAAMFDAWAIYEPDVASLFTLASSEYADCRLINNFRVKSNQNSSMVNLSARDKELAQNQAVGMAAWTLLEHRFRDSRNNTELLEQFQNTAQAQGLQGLVSTGFNRGEIASAQYLGTQVGRCIIANGLDDGSNEQQGYSNLDYSPANPPLDPTTPGNPRLIDPNRWQPLKLSIFMDQSGNVTDTPEFLGADWGRLQPFGLQVTDKTYINIDGTRVPVWLDPGAPPRLGNDPDSNRIYQLNHLSVALWSANLDPFSEQTIDISPGALGNLPPLDSFPDDQPTILNEYNSTNGGMIRNAGHAINPSTCISRILG